MHSKRPETIGAWLLLAAAVIDVVGLSWDVQWHSDVGPDTFFTLPHLVMYTASALYGCTSLAMVLYRSFRRPHPEIRSVSVFGTFRAPLGFLVAGLGAAAGLLYGLMDLWWHTVYGFDATPTSPPHVGLSLCGMISGVGAVIAFASLRDTRSGRTGLAVLLGVACYSNIFLMLSTPELSFVASVPLAIALFCVLVMILSAAVTRSAISAIVTGSSFAATHVVMWFSMPPLTRAYAAAIDLPVRDYVDGTSVYAALLPLAFLPVALLVAGGLAVARRFMSPKLAVPVVGALAAGVLMVAYLAQFGVLDAGTVVGATVLGIGVGWIGWRASAPLRTLLEA
jgi:hypothetical protein